MVAHRLQRSGSVVLPRNPLRADSWDVFASSTSDGSLRSGFALASQLAEAAQVTLYVDSVELLARRIRHLDAGLLLQYVDGMELCAMELAGFKPAAARALRVFDVPLPSAYLSWIARQNSVRHLYWVHPMNRAAHQLAGELPAPGRSLRTHHVRQGLPPDGDGFIRDGTPTPPLRAKWQSSSRLKEATLRRLGVQCGPLDEGRFTVYVGQAAGGRWGAVTRAMARTPTPLHVLVGDGPERAQVQRYVQESGLIPSAVDRLRISFLPDMSWAVADETVWLSDVVITSSEELAMRAARAGTPMLWTGSDATRRILDPIEEWYRQEAAPTLDERISALSLAVAEAGEREILRQWEAYRHEYLDALRLAAGVASRLGEGPDVLTALLRPHLVRRPVIGVE